MKKLIVIALFCIAGVTSKAQSLRLLESYPAYYNDYAYASDPIVTLDSLTGYLNYSYTVNYPVGAQRSDVNWGGTLLNIGIVLNPYGTIIPLDVVDNETDDYTTLPTGQVVHSGSFYIGSYFSDLRLVFISASTSFVYFSDPHTGSNFHGYNTYDEYEFIP